jgi:hypothetical protein
MTKHKSQNPDRDEAIVLMREGGMTLREIAETVGLSVERAIGTQGYQLEFQSSPETPCFGSLRLKLRWPRSQVVTL